MRKVPTLKKLDSQIFHKNLTDLKHQLMIQVFFFFLARAQSLWDFLPASG